MHILADYPALSAYIKTLKNEKKTIGFIPTMGALHEGHLSLYKAAKSHNDVLIFSIFVNPTQFNNENDLIKYPRTVDADLQLLEKHGVNAVYVPRIDDIYPEGAKSRHFEYGGIADKMEGKMRPGHFDGVGTVVAQLLRQVQPDNAYFGEKDYQQLAIIKKLVKIEKLRVHIHGVPIYRAKSGLAFSSRNARLTAQERENATIIYKTLLKVKDWFKIISVKEIEERVKEIFKATPYQLEYFLIADEKTLQKTDFHYKGKKYRAFIVVWVRDVRLIDNMALE